MGRFVKVPVDIPFGLGDPLRDLTAMAAYSDWSHGGVPLQRGEVLVSARYLADRWGKSWSKSRTDRVIHSMVKLGYMRDTGKLHKRDRRGTVYALVLYEEMMGSDSGSGTQDGTQAGTKNQSNKNQKKQRDDYSPEFLEAWQVHPNGGKKVAAKAYHVAVPTKVSHATFVSRLGAYHASLRDGFVGLHFSTFTNQEHFHGDAPAPSNNGRPSHGRLRARQGDDPT